MSAADLVAQVTAVTGLDERSAAAIVKLAESDPPAAAALLQSYQDAAAEGTPSFVEEAWKYLQVGLNIAVPLAGALETAAGLPGAAKSLL